jgi:plastocyanin
MRLTMQCKAFLFAGLTTAMVMSVLTGCKEIGSGTGGPPPSGSSLTIQIDSTQQNCICNGLCPVFSPATDTIQVGQHFDFHNNSRQLVTIIGGPPAYTLWVTVAPDSNSPLLHFSETGLYPFSCQACTGRDGHNEAPFYAHIAVTRE